MVSLENTRNTKGGFSFEQITNSNEDLNEQPQLSFSSGILDNVPLTSETEPSFKQIKTTFLILLHLFISILFIVFAFIVPLVCGKDSIYCSIFESFDIILFIHALYWIIFYIFDRVYQYHHMKSRRNGYLEFYRSTRLVRSLPLVIISAGNAILIVLLRVFNKYCAVSCTDAKLTPLNFVQIFTSGEFALIFIVLVDYLCNYFKLILQLYLKGRLFNSKLI